MRTGSGTSLGSITEAIERRLILRLAGKVGGRNVLVQPLDGVGGADGLPLIAWEPQEGEDTARLTIRNVLNKVRVTDQPAVKADLHAIMNAGAVPRARSAARRFADRWVCGLSPGGRLPT